MYSELSYLNECVEGVYIRTDAAEPSEIARKSDTKNTVNSEAKRVIKRLAKRMQNAPAFDIYQAALTKSNIILYILSQSTARYRRHHSLWVIVTGASNIVGFGIAQELRFSRFQHRIARLRSL